MAAQNKAINLLPKSEFEVSFWGKFLGWSLTAGRYIIILTELVVIMAFLSRFKLDRDLLELGDNIAGKKALLDATLNTEANFLTTQARLNYARQILTDQPGSADLLNNFISQIPTDMGFTALSMDHTNREVGLTARAASQQVLGQFLKNMQDHGWKNLNLNDVSGDPVGEVTFIFQASY